MALFASQKMTTINFFLWAWFYGWANLSLANSSPGFFEMTADLNDKGWQLQAKQLSLPQILERLADKAKISIHYSAVSEQLININCGSEDLAGLVKCAAGDSADLMFRYGQSTTHPSEIWLIGKGDTTAVVTSSPDKPIIVKDKSVESRASVTKKDSAKNPEENLLVLAKSPDPEVRADAIAKLSLSGTAADAPIKKILADALHDDNPRVREQAIAKLANDASYQATEQLHSALQDSNASVRLMAVDAAGNNTQLLQQALTDSDETVRLLATNRLQQLTKTTTNK